MDMEGVEEEGGCSSTVKETVVGRKSTRKRKAVSRSDDKETDSPPAQKIKKVKTTTGKPFSCDKCKSRCVVNPLRRKPGQKSKGKATPRHVVDPESQKLLTLCNACGLQMERKSKASPRDPPPSDEDKKRYYDSAEHFAASLVEGLGETDAEKLTCPVYKTKPCGCIQKFIIGEGDREMSKKRAFQLLSILKDAKRLREKKFYNREEVLSKGKGQRKVGLGNGHRKSKEYEDFVLANRKILRGDLRMCERATQRILHYSNNFLHKRLKTDPQNRTQRLKRTRGQAAMGKLDDISKLPEQTCCTEKCVMLAQSHSLLLNQWRERAASGQTEARKVLAEMLTPSGQGSNCARFIAMVTGSSITTIARVKEQMWKTGGNREPPQHGLKKYWKNRPKSKSSLLDEDGEVRGATRAGSSEAGGGGQANQGSLMTVSQLIEQQDQLKRLQQQLEEQQQQVRQQQRLVEQQLVQHQLRQNRQMKRQAAMAEAQRKVSNQRRAGSSKQSNTSTAQPTPQNMPSNREAASSVTMQQVTPDQQGRLYVQPPASTNQQARSAVTQLLPSNQQVPTIVGVNIEPQTLPQVAQQSQQQQQEPQPLTATVAGLEGIDAKLLQQNLQQILAELQSQMVTQQFQQQLMNCGIQQGPGVSSQPPSYSTAVAATNHTQVIQAQQQQQQQVQQKTQKDGSQQTQIIIQTIPSLQPSMLLSSNGQGLPGSTNVPQYVNASTSGSMARIKAAGDSHVMVPITLHHPGNQSTGEEAINVEEVNVQLQEVVMPLSTQDAEACNMVLPRPQQLPTILQGTIQQHLPHLGQLASHTSDATRPTTTTISIEGICDNQQTTPGNMGDLVVTEVEEASHMMSGGEEVISSSIPLVGGVSVETLLSPEALHLLNSTGQASMNVSLSSARAMKQSTTGSATM